MDDVACAKFNEESRRNDQRRPLRNSLDQRLLLLSPFRFPFFARRENRLQDTRLAL